MKLHRVDITHFRCFEDLTIPLQPDVNVFVGVNGSGKTAILDAVAMLLWDVVAASGGGTEKERIAQKVALQPSDIHVRFDATNGSEPPHEFVRIRGVARDYYKVRNDCDQFLFDLGEVFLEWDEYISFRPPASMDYGKRRSSALYQYIENLWARIYTTGPATPVPLPVVAYYRAHRRIQEMPDLFDSGVMDTARKGAFRGALNASASCKTMLRWFYLRENQELREKLQIRKEPTFEFPDLKAVRSAIAQTVENVAQMFFDGTPPRLKIAMEDPDGSRRVFNLSN